MDGPTALPLVYTYSILWRRPKVSSVTIKQRYKTSMINNNISTNTDDIETARRAH